MTRKYPPVRTETFPRGMTLVELLIVLAMMGLVLAASLPNIRSTVAGFRHNSEVSQLTSRLFLSRQMAVREKQPYIMTLDTANGRYTIFEDTDGDGIQDAGETTLGPYAMDVGMNLVNVSWAGSRMTFFPNGRTSQSGDIQVVADGGQTKTIRVNSTTGNAEVLP